MRLFKAILLFLILGILFGNCVIKKGYNLYLIVDVGCNANAESKVFFEGKEVGQVKLATVIDTSKLMLKLFINEGVKMPRDNKVKCMENILGDVFIDIESEKKGPINKITYLQSQDTLYGIYTTRYKKLDSVAKKQIFDKLNDLKNTVDSIINKSDSAISR